MGRGFVFLSPWGGFFEAGLALFNRKLLSLPLEMGTACAVSATSWISISVGYYSNVQKLAGRRTIEEE